MFNILVATIGKKVTLNIRQFICAQISETAGISLTHMSNIETANTKLSLDVLLKIANALNCNADVLLCGNIVDNLSQTSLIIFKILEDCTNTERTIIIDTIQSLKNTLIKNRKEAY